MNAEGVPGLKHTKGLYDVEHGKHHAKSRTMAIREAVHSAGDALDGAVLCQHQTGVGDSGARPYSWANARLTRRA